MAKALWQRSWDNCEDYRQFSL